MWDRLVLSLPSSPAIPVVVDPPNLAPCTPLASLKEGEVRALRDRLVLSLHSPPSVPVLVGAYTLSPTTPLAILLASLASLAPPAPGGRRGERQQGHGAEEVEVAAQAGRGGAGQAGVVLQRDPQEVARAGPQAQHARMALPGHAQRQLHHRRVRLLRVVHYVQVGAHLADRGSD